MSFPDLPALKGLLLQAIFVCGLLALVAGRFVTKAATRIVVILVIASVAGGIWLYRDTLDECAKTCDCKLAGRQVRVPTCKGQEDEPRKKII